VCVPGLPRATILRHEAAQSLVGYLLGMPIINYDLVIGREHVYFDEAKIQMRLIQSSLSSKQMDQLAVLAIASVAAGAAIFDEVRASRETLLVSHATLHASVLLPELEPVGHDATTRRRQLRSTQERTMLELLYHDMQSSSGIPGLAVST
jgi:hypothetical protein